LAENNEDFIDWVNSYIRAYAERDLRLLFGYDLNTSIISRLWQMIAAAQSGLWNAESYSRALGVTAPVVNRYLDFMEGAFLVRKLQPWFANVQKRLVKAPKVYVRDSGLVHALNRIVDYDMLLGHSVAGGSWEGYIIEQIMAKAGEDIKPFFYRTHNGAEADLVLVKGNIPMCCIEIKLTNAPTISKGFHASIADIGTDKNYVITPGSDTYPGGKNITVCSVQYFLKNYLVGF
jgi:predicted AAA+ superfamily ATPase